MVIIPSPVLLSHLSNSLHLSFWHPVGHIRIANTYSAYPQTDPLVLIITSSISTVRTMKYWLPSINSAIPRPTNKERLKVGFLNRIAGKNPIGTKIIKFPTIFTIPEITIMGLPLLMFSIKSFMNSNGIKLTLYPKFGRSISNSKFPHIPLVSAHEYGGHNVIAKTPKTESRNKIRPTSRCGVLLSRIACNARFLYG